MRKILAVLGLVILSVQSLSAQIIQGYDTVCVGTPLQLTSSITNANSYYWGFCSAYLNNTPQGSSIAAGTGLDQPRSIAIAIDTVTDDQYMFVVSNGPTREVIRYDFGQSLANAPVATNLGSFGGVISANPKGMWFAQDADGWHGFLVAGNGPVNSQLIRMDFGNNLSSLPTVTDMGNLGGLLLNPQDLYIFTEGGNWYGFTNSGFTGDLIRFDFGANLSMAPTVNNLGNPGGLLGFPTGFWPAMEGGNWHLFVVNAITNSVVRLDFGNSLLNAVGAQTDLGNFGGHLSSARDISIIRDCDNWYGFVTNENSDNIIKLTFPGTLTSVPTSQDLMNFAGLDGPIYLTSFARSRDNIFAFTANNDDNSLSRLEFNSCLVPDIKNTQFRTPPPVTYNQAGVYNVYLALDEGLPTMQVECKLITVIEKPLMIIQNDTTICKGDTIQITANGQNLTGIQWNPTYNMIPPTGDTETVILYPNESFEYGIQLEFASGGCIHDTSVTITVSQVVADAGEDRFVADGAYTILGGPTLSFGPEYSYVWTPSTYLDDATAATPRVDPRGSQFYILQVTNDSSGCVRTDSVRVFNECTDIHLPNAFNPTSDVSYNREFGIMNNQLFKLNHFRIFNRWGQVVFETTTPGIYWDGNHNNIPAPSGTYVWQVDGECNNGKRIQKTGNVFLVR